MDARILPGQCCTLSLPGPFFGGRLTGGHDVHVAMCQSRPVVLDLDGVIIQSNRIKYIAMLALFDQHPHEYAAIDSYIAANYGVRRDHKIAHILAAILRIEPTQALVADYLARYDVALAPLLHDAPLVPGVDVFLAQGRRACYVSSSAPDVEVRDQLSRRGLSGCFQSIFGAATPKVDVLRRVRHLHRGQAPVFFGDSPGDRDAADQAGVAFVAVTSERDNFPDQPVVKLRDFASLDAVEASMAAARVSSNS